MSMTETLLKQIADRYPLTEIPAGNMAALKAGGMKFTIRAYQAEGLGQVSVMLAKGFFGLMKMDTLIINPTQLDLPLYSYDRIFAMGNDTLIVELYDTQLELCSMDTLEAVKATYTDLEERDPGQHWYDSLKLPESISKKGKKAQTSRFDALTQEHFKAYLGLSCKSVSGQSATYLKQEKTSRYVEGLLTNGGPSTDVFKKTLGDEKTATLFRKILFGTE